MKTAAANSGSVANRAKIGLWLAAGLALLVLIGIALWITIRPADIVTL